jgi:NNP family nitrate/nitrite transporter-like MFS transporter
VPGGSWSDRFGGEKVALLAYTALLAGAGIMTLSQDFWLTVLGEALVATGMGVANAAVFKLVPHYVPHAVGGTAGWVGGLGALGGFVVPPILGHMAQTMGTIGYIRGYSVYIGLAMLSIGLTSLLYATRTGITLPVLRAPRHESLTPP